MVEELEILVNIFFVCLWMLRLLVQVGTTIVKKRLRQYTFSDIINQIKYQKSYQTYLFLKQSNLFSFREI